MNKKEMTEKFQELFSNMASGDNVGKMKLFGRVMGDMMQELIETHPEKAEEYLERLEAVKWKNYLTQKEAEQMVAEMEPAAPWSREQWMTAMKQHGYELEKWPCYNSCALWTEMNMLMSESSKTISKYVQSSDQFKVVHDLAVDKLAHRHMQL